MTTSATMHHDEIIRFWFEELNQKDWWIKNEQTDALIRDRYLAIHKDAIDGKLSFWRHDDYGRLAEIIILDQFSRNMFRGTLQSFSYDQLALDLAEQAVSVNTHQRLTGDHCAFLLMPFMHSESVTIHEKALQLFTGAGLKEQVKFELKHKAIIDRFGRYPHRNQILGRESTEKEIEFLKQPGSSF